MMGRLGLVAAAAALVSCGAIGAASLPTLPSVPGTITVPVVTKALSLNSNDSQLRTAGTLRYLGGLDISSTDKRFGGISGLRVLPDKRLLAVSDRGDWIVLRLHESKEQLLGIADVQMAPLLDAEGKTFAADDRDSESVELDLLPTGDTDVHVSFERRHRVLTYRWPASTPLETMFNSKVQGSENDLALWLKSMPNNGGAEAHVVKSGANFIVSEDRVHANGGHDSRLSRSCPGCGAPTRRTIDLGLAREADFKPTDAHWLQSSDGHDQLLVLLRSFSPLTGVRAKLKLFDLTGIKPDALVTGETLLTLAPPLSVDNMEGLALDQRDARVMLYLVSDNNFNGLQRTLLMKFEWVRPQFPSKDKTTE